MNETWNSHKKLNLFSYLVFSLFLTACDLPDLEGEDPNALVEISYNEYLSSFDSELKKVSLDQIEVGEMVEYKSTYVAEIGEPKPYEDIKRTVTKSYWDESPGVVVMEYQRVDHLDNKNSFVRDEIWEIPFPNTLSTLNFMSLLTPGATADPVVEYKLYNLSTRSVNLMPPKNVLKKPNCGGLQGCIIEGIEARFIVHKIVDGVIVDRQQRKEVVSHQIPPLYYYDMSLLPIVQSCNRFLFEGVLVNMCTTLSDIDNK